MSASGREISLKGNAKELIISDYSHADQINFV